MNQEFNKLFKLKGNLKYYLSKGIFIRYKIRIGELVDILKTRKNIKIDRTDNPNQYQDIYIYYEELDQRKRLIAIPKEHNQRFHLIADLICKMFIAKCPSEPCLECSFVQTQNCEESLDCICQDENNPPRFYIDWESEKTNALPC